MYSIYLYFSCINVDETNVIWMHCFEKKMLIGADFINFNDILSNIEQGH